MILDILKLPDPRLRVPCEPVETVTDELRALVADMWATMKAASGVGLSANQVGRTERIAVIHVADQRGNSFKRALANLEVTVNGPRRRLPEGCLSMPDRTVLLPRGLVVKYQGMDLDGRWETGTAAGYAAQVLQHECDHLDGYLITAPRRGK